MLVNTFQEVYNLFKMKFYESLCSNPKELTMQEAFSLDIIYMLNEPTILEYATYMKISQPNATYKINQMVEKGYLIKQPSHKDKRAYTLKVSDKFLSCYRTNNHYIKKILGKIEENTSETEIDLLIQMLKEVKKQMTQEEQHD